MSPVCGRNYASYSNLCELQQAGEQLLHEGACLPGEGLNCDVNNPSLHYCGDSGQFYCRDTCPQCSSGLLVPRCTKIGACVFDFDCNQQPVPEIVCMADGGSGGSLTGTCVNNTCQYQCQ